MAIQTDSKLNQLLRILPEGMVADARWLQGRGYSRSLRKQYVDGGWLESPCRGVFHRPGTKPSWQGVLTSLQQLLKYPVSTGGSTALQLGGYSHYRRLHEFTGQAVPVHLYADQKLPGWAKKIDVGTTLVQHNRQRFLNSLSSDPSQRSETKEQFATDESDPFLQANALREYSQDGYSLIASTPERAILEMLDELPKDESFHAVDMAMESLVDLSPIRVQALLERATSIKVKRLFFFFADRHRHAWLSRIDRHRVDLGSGKRMLVKDGVLDTTYGITVPRDFDRTNKGRSPTQNIHV